MLQQTQVATVIPYYLKFLERFPALADLAAAPQDDVLACWSGLGYYSRARNLHAAAQAIVRDHDGVFPRQAEAIQALPGIGRSTAAAICAFAWGQRLAILDGNVKRVLSRYLGISGHPGERVVENRLWAAAEQLLPAGNVEAYIQAQMDLGSLICVRSRPRCASCPVQADCVAWRDGLTAALPTPKPRKAVPERSTVMLLIRQGGRILLEKRPDSGIWGGLWSLPEVASTHTADLDCQRRYALNVTIGPALPDIVHTFTHFRLTITPQPVDVTAETGVASATGTHWFTPEEALRAGIPVPVRKILQHLRSGLF